MHLLFVELIGNTIIGHEYYHPRQNINLFRLNTLQIFIHGRINSRHISRHGDLQQFIFNW